MKKFTFHYASTLLEPGIRKCIILLNLHSTMLLLYSVPDYFVEVDFFIYIPLCFYFIICLDWESNQNSQIYIPLCFYFIPNHSVMAPQFFTNLHSTMLLLYSCTLHVVIPSGPVIYIPLCFYFIPDAGRFDGTQI